MRGKAAIFLVGLMCLGPPGVAQSTGPGMMTVQAIRMIERVRAYAKAHDLKLGIAAVDADGELVAAVRMDGAPSEVTDRALALAKKAVFLIPDAIASDAKGAHRVFVESHLLGALAASGADDGQIDAAVLDGIQAVGASEVVH
jgi:hypothetical protein